MKTRREPTKVVFGGSAINAGDLESLRIAWRKRKLVLFLGAGVSIASGIPSWKTLVLELLFEQTQQARRMQDIWPHYGRALASWLTDYFEYDPVILARAVKTDLMRRMKREGGPNRSGGRAATTFEERVRVKLYATYRTARTNNPTLQAVADFIEWSVLEQNLAGVINFNFDDLLEQELTNRKITHSSIFSAAHLKRAGLSILHPHGFLPQTGKVDDGELIFTEDEYHGLIESSFHWALTEIVHSLRHSTALFIGLSMSDPSLRRLLDASRDSHAYPVHFQMLKRHVVPDSDTDQVLADVEGRAQRIGKMLGMDERKKPDQLVEVMHAALRQADTYDRQLFESMKVKTLWLESHDDIPQILRAVARRRVS